MHYLTQAITLIVAADSNNAIGVDNNMPWYIPEDIVFFKDYTMGKPIIMGRKTWQSLPKKPLIGRYNVVMSRNIDYVANGAKVFTSIEEVLSAYHNEPEICIIGGTEIYRQTMDLATDLRVTEVALKIVNANHFFPEISTDIWQEICREKKHSSKNISFSWVHYQKIGLINTN